jgi:hypothetical protein
MHIFFRRKAVIGGLKETVDFAPRSEQVMGSMGRVRRGGYVLTWWKGDHPPPHVHVRTQAGRKLGRLNLATLQGMEGWMPEARLLRIIKELREEGRI